MFNRLRRVLRSFVGFFISVAENPEVILEQNIRDMNDQVPRMNESIAMVKANVTLLEKEETKYKRDMNELAAKVKAAIQAGRDDLAGMFASQLEQLKLKIEEEAEKLRANELVKQFKVEMGLASPDAAAPSTEKTIGGREAQKTS